MIVAVDDVFVVRIPTTMTPVAPFSLRDSMVLPSLRAETERQLSDSRYRWSAVAVGADGRPGLGLNATTEQEAVEGLAALPRSALHPDRGRSVQPLSRSLPVRHR